jgi:hypothetical protein
VVFKEEVCGYSISGITDKIGLMQPTTPDGQFDFMLKNNPPPKSGFLPNIPKIVKIIVATTIGVMLIAIIASIFTGRSNVAGQPMINSLAEAQEILRVTALTGSQLPLQDPTVQALAATVSSTLTSDQSSLNNYLSKNGVKISKLELSAKTDKTTDAQLQSASQNNNLDAAYQNYLKDSLAKYALSLQTAYKVSGPKGQELLKNAFDSTTVILTSPPIKTQ